VIANVGDDLEPGDEGYVAGEQLASICTDLWACSIADLDHFVATARAKFEAASEKERAELTRDDLLSWAVQPGDPRERLDQLGSRARGTTSNTSASHVFCRLQLPRTRDNLAERGVGFRSLLQLPRTRDGCTRLRARTYRSRQSTYSRSSASIFHSSSWPAFSAFTFAANHWWSSPSRLL
jgi:hypothetical protein